MLNEANDEINNRKILEHSHKMFHANEKRNCNYVVEKFLY